MTTQESIKMLQGARRQNRQEQIAKRKENVKRMVERAEKLANAGTCEGGVDCQFQGGHSGYTHVVHVLNPSGIEVGFYSYCENAIRIDTERGFYVSIRE